jgi:hypothetical protein
MHNHIPNQARRPGVWRTLRDAVFPAALLIIQLLARNCFAAASVGVHSLAFFPCNSSGGLTTPAIATQTAGSTILAWVGRGDTNGFTGTVPVDNKANTYRMLGSLQDYSPLYPGSGEGLYAVLSAAGGSGHRVTAPMPAGADEITLAVVEVKNGGAIQDVQFKKVLSAPHTSPSVTTTGPATLIAVWAGDSGAASVTATPNNGFATIDSQLLSSCEVEVVVAARDVAAAGSYNVTWTATPAQGAHLWLVAIQTATAPSLEAQLAGGNVILTWPDSATNYNLQSSPVLIGVPGDGGWTLVTNTPVIVNSRNTVTNAPSGRGQYYRLKKQ